MPRTSALFAPLALLALTPAAAQWTSTDPSGKPLPPAANQAQQGEFGVMQISTTDPQALWAAWAQKTPGVELHTQNTATRNQPIVSFIVFTGCTPDAQGHCNVTVDFEVLDPSGKTYGRNDNAPVVDGAAPAKGMLGLSNGSLGLRVEAGEQLGDYRVLAHTTDHVSGVTLATQQTLTITEAP